MEEHVVYLALGSNLGDKRRNVRRAIQKIEELIGTVRRRSALHASRPWGFSSDHSFVNAVVCCVTTLSPREVLGALQHIERLMGKDKVSAKGPDGRLLEGETYHDRIIDIDILLYDDLSIDEPDLHIPHPLMHERDFVMTPLREVLDRETTSGPT